MTELTPSMLRAMHRPPALRDKKEIERREAGVVLTGNDHPTDNPRTPAKLEQDSRHGPLAAEPSKACPAGRVHIRFESVRKRLLDPDNISEKWTLDCLRFAGCILGDESDKITLETTQRRTEKGEEEHTDVTITYPS